nr:hypothetical protein 17 [Legionellales bacterium]
MKEIGDNTTEVQEDFELIAFDFVSNPSTHGAFMSPLREGKEHTKESKFVKVEEIISEILAEI